VDGTYSEAALYSLCGELSYVQYDNLADTIPTATYDSTIFQALTYGARTSASPELVVSYHSTDSTKAGGIGGSGDRYAQTVYRIYIMGQMGTYYKRRGYATIDLTVIDDCWYSVISSPAPFTP